MANRFRKGVLGQQMRIAPANTYNDPTVTPIVGEGGSQDVVNPSEYFAVRIDTTTRPVDQGPAKVVLFDASQGYQIKTGTVTPANAVVTGVTDDYQFLLNDVAHVASMVDVLQLSVNDPAKALQQYGRPIEIYDIVRGGGVNLTKTIHPRKGINETQYHKDINTFDAKLRITNRTAMVIMVEPGIVLDIGFYQKAELGRKN